MTLCREIMEIYNSTLIFETFFQFIQDLSITEILLDGIKVATQLTFTALILRVQYKLTLCHIIPTFNDPEKEAILKTSWEKEEMLKTND